MNGRVRIIGGIDEIRVLGRYICVINAAGEEEKGLTIHAAEITLEIVGPRRAQIESHPTRKHARIDSKVRKVRVRKLAEDITWHQAEDAEVRVLCFARVLVRASL